jgi:hypothetical protein
MMEAKIKLTKTMLNKSIIDANKTVQQFLDYVTELENTYDTLASGESMTVGALYENDSPTFVNFYRAKGRGDKRISIQNLRKFAEEGDTIKLRLLDERVIIEDMIFDVRVVVYKEDDDQQGETVAA